MKRARWWMRRRWRPSTFAEYMATPGRIAQRDAIADMCDAVLRRVPDEEFSALRERERRLRPEGG